MRKTEITRDQTSRSERLENQKQPKRVLRNLISQFWKCPWEPLSGFGGLQTTPPVPTKGLTWGDSVNSFCFLTIWEAKRERASCQAQGRSSWGTRKWNRSCWSKAWLPGGSPRLNPVAQCDVNHAQSGSPFYGIIFPHHRGGIQVNRAGFPRPCLWEQKSSCVRMWACRYLIALESGKLCVFGGGSAESSQSPRASQNLVGWKQAQVCCLSSAQAEPDPAEDPEPTPKIDLDRKVI